MTPASKLDMQKPSWQKKLEYGFKLKIMILNHCCSISCAPIFCRISNLQTMPINISPQALRGWLWPGILQSPCAAHPAHTHTCMAQHSGAA